MAFQYRKDLECCLDHEITLKILKLILSLTDKVKPFFFYSPQRVYFLNQMGQNRNLAAFTSKI